MHVMTVKMRPQLVPALAKVPGLELTVLDDPSYTPDYREVETIREVIPYRTRGKLDRRAIHCLREAVARCRPDIIHAFYGRALSNALLATSRIRPQPQIVSFRGITAPPSLLDPSNWLSYRHPRVAAHACESNAVRDVMIGSGIAPEKCVTIYNCVPVGRYNCPGRSALADLGIPEDAFVVGTVATMRPVKGIDLLLRAAQQCSNLSNVWWLLIGQVKDGRIPRLAADPRIASRVKLTGHRSDAASLISAADLFVMPSRAEALSIALLEGMLQGVCPIVSDAGGMKELVRHQQDGLVVPREDVPALVSAIRHLHGRPNEVARYATAAAERIRTFASPSCMATRAAAMYRGLFQSGRSKAA